MDVLSLSAPGNSIFSAGTIRASGLESLANAALERGIDAYMKKDFEGAVKEFKRSVSIGRNSSFAADAAQYLAMSYTQLGDIDNAVKAYRKACQIDPYRDDIHVKLGNLHFSQSKFEDARGQYAEAVRLNPSTANRYALGQAFIELGRYPEAESQYAEITRMAPEQAGGYLGMGLAFSRQDRYDEAINQFQEAVGRDPDLYEAYAQIGYAQADLGDMESAQAMVHHLEGADQLDLADTLSRYMYKVDRPKMVFGSSSSSFLFSLGKGTSLVALNSSLMNANAAKGFTMTIQFEKAMDRESVENPANWLISRAAGRGPGQAYNFGLRIPPTEIQIRSIPEAVTWDAENLTATVHFTIRQNADASGTIDPSHIEFRFSGKDIYGLSMNPKFDQFNGFAGVV